MAQQLKVFVSHSSSDKSTCDQFVTALRRAGADVWYDEHNLGAGQLMDEIQRELHARPVFVVLLSPAALASKWVQRECKWAYTLADQDPSRILLPVVVSAIEPKELLAAMLFLSDFKRVEGPGNKPYPQGEAIERTLRLLQLTPEGQAPAAAAPQAGESAADLVTQGRALWSQGKYSETLPFFERATQLDATNFDAWHSLGLSLSGVDRDQEALAALERAVAINPNDATAWSNRGGVLVRLRRFQEAISSCDHALALFENKTAAWVAWYEKAEALRALGRTAEAKEADRHAEKLLGFATSGFSEPPEIDSSYGKAFAAALEAERKVVKEWEGG